MSQDSSWAGDTWADALRRIEQDMEAYEFRPQPKPHIRRIHLEESAEWAYGYFRSRWSFKPNIVSRTIVNISKVLVERKRKHDLRMSHNRTNRIR